jgi:16S rRNA (cytidine1402-2'-O)-methyltransferase
VRRTAKATGAARVNSGGNASGRFQPNRRSDASKRDRTTPSRRAEPAAAEVYAAESVTESALAPGLYLVATPIGNLADITLRALAVLRGVDRIFCEDTRITGKLLARYAISTRLAVYHDHNAEEVRPAILAALHRGERVALVSDAGTPLVSDPGYKLVRSAIAENLPITAVPGPSAAVIALILSGLPPDAFLFAGFLPTRQTARRRALERWAAVEASLVFFESTPRLVDSLADMVMILGDRPAAIARELTKLHEEIRRGGLADLADYYRLGGPPRGEAVIVVAPPIRGEPDKAQVDERLRKALAELGVREAAAKLAAETGLSRGKLYRRALAIRDEKT